METNDPYKEYEFALIQLHKEADVIWNYSQVYILANTVIIGFLAQQAMISVERLFVAVGGFLISFVWLASSERRWGWYNFRMTQAKSYEKKIEKFELLNGQAELFSEGQKADKIKG